AGGGEVGGNHFIVEEDVDDFLEFLVFLIDFLKAFHIADDSGVGELFFHVAEAVNDGFQFIEHKCVRDFEAREVKGKGYIFNKITKSALFSQVCRGYCTSSRLRPSVRSP